MNLGREYVASKLLYGFSERVPTILSKHYQLEHHLEHMHACRKISVPHNLP